MKKVKKETYRALLLLVLIFVLSVLNIVIKDFYIDDNTNPLQIDVEDVSRANADNVRYENPADISKKSVKPSGLPIGIYVKTEGVMVVDTGVVTGYDGRLYSPCKDILYSGDYVVEIDGEKIQDKKSLVEAVDSSDGKTIDVVVIRDNNKMNFEIEPVKTE